MVDMKLVLGARGEFCEIHADLLAHFRWHQGPVRYAGVGMDGADTTMDLRYVIAMYDMHSVPPQGLGLVF
jgi:hypothetical protein